jgi:DNA-binding IclR family transcriptional regulator
MGRRRDSQAPPHEAAQDRRYVTALARGLDVLGCFTPRDRWLKHQEIARRSGLPASTVSRLTFTLAALGYLRHREASGEYALAPAVLALGFSMLSNFDIGRIARPWMQAMADHAQAAISLGVRRELSMIYVAHCRSTARLTLGLDVGTRLPLANTAMGRAVWCGLQPAERERIAARLALEQGEAWPSLREALARADDQHRRCGYVTSEAEWESEISAVGVLLDLGDGREPLGLTCGGPTARLQGPLLHEDLAPRLVETARQITRAIQAADWSD